MRTIACVAGILALATSCRLATETDDQRERLFTMEIADTTVACMGPFPMTCMLTRERADQPYHYFYDGIAGFTYEPGYHYVLRVASHTIPNPPADGASVGYRLIEVLSKTPVPGH